ncbi:DnaJ-domain-containing protein [Phialemonium atrogriseum]|uniref:DnaJ-domain-containing protein n=1 Tax=Phialemonium atrogriseum TaxID=1093897 RepID=A0AAJ0FK58_9PEZI|nr:DnaJ-domain-containing protein [Phialemonium atrogriseum]KAK1770697.1 DnaJ-domain-containing protein [Phialemonium atrogriseum]
MMNKLPPDPWRILGLEKTADKTEIRSTYKKLVLKCHPDKVQDPTLKAQKQDEFQKVQQAYELLIDDAERIKYEEQVKLAELRKQAAMMSKNMANSPAARTPTKQHFTYEIRTAEPRFKSSSPHDIPPASAKVYPQYHSARSWDDDMSPRTQAIYEEERRARRAASYEEPSRRDDERREERRRKERDEDRDRDRERREKEARDLRRAEKKRQEKDRDKERKRDQEDKRRQKSPYVEPYEEDEVFAFKVEKKKSSSSKKHDEPREKSSSRRDRERERERERVRERERDERELREKERQASPHAPRKLKTETYLEAAASYIERSRSKPSLPRAQTFAEPATYFNPPISVPTPPPPPVEFIDDDVRRSSARASGRRASNDVPMPIRSKEKVYASRKKSSREGIDIIDSGSPRARAIPSLQKSHSTPPVVPESPPRPNRVNTLPKEMYARPSPGPPSFGRTNTWAAGEDGDRTRRPVAYYDRDSDDEPLTRRSRRTQSPEPVEPVSYRYRVEGHKTTKMDPAYEYDEQPPARRYSEYSSKVVEPKRESSSSSRDYYPSHSQYFPKVKQTKTYTEADVAFSNFQYAPAVHPPDPVWATS